MVEKRRVRMKACQAKRVNRNKDQPQIGGITSVLLGKEVIDEASDAAKDVSCR